MTTLHFLFITSSNLATNPRLYKELKLALNNDYRCSVIQFKLGNWSDAKTEELLKGLIDEGVKRLGDARLNVINLDATSSNKLNWLKWGILETIAKKFYRFFKQNLKINTLANSRRAFQILNACFKLKYNADIICAHNLASLYPAHILGQKWKVPFTFDVEDYHPGELIQIDAINEKKRREFLMTKLLPKANVITSASPLIGEYTINLIGGHSNHQTILNSFPQKEFEQPASAPHIFDSPVGENPLRLPSSNIIPNSQELTANSSLRLVWFSQKISFGRGLEQLFEALNLFIEENTSFIENRTSKIQLTLIGEIDSEFEKQIIDPFKSNIILHASNIEHHKSNIINLTLLPPLSQSALHAELANHDVGLALEFNSTDLNRQLCLTNKIMAYKQAGLFILATDTPSQQQFMEEYPESGLICEQTGKGIKTGVEEILNNSNKITTKHFDRLEKGKRLAWEYEQKKLHLIWNELLNETSHEYHKVLLNTQKKIIIRT